MHLVDTGMSDSSTVSQSVKERKAQDIAVMWDDRKKASDYQYLTNNELSGYRNA